VIFGISERLQKNGAKVHNISQFRTSSGNILIAFFVLLQIVEAMSKNTNTSQIEIKNRKADYQYFLLTSYTAGIVLTGTEIKSIRAGKANITDAYCSFIQNELWVHNMHVSEYANGSYNNHQPKRDRKLLLTKKEMRKLLSKLNERGFTIVPTLLWINEKGYAKLDISLAKGKKLYDKRESIKEKDERRRKQMEDE
jgi:SsrA-binding protein